MRVLSAKYPTFQSAAAEIINLDAILRLPKGTEHFLSDVHGEYEAFCHIMNNCSGVIREKVEALYGKVMTKSERDEFATLIYYPAAIIAEMKAKGVAELKEWYAVQLHRLLEVCKTVASKYTRSKVRKSLPRNFDYIIDELINMDRTDFNKEAYYNEIFASIIELNRAEDFIVAITDVIKRLAVDALHIVGDLFDRGENPDKIMDLLMQHHNADLQWGNHDISWMGAHMGNEACILTVVDISLKYCNIDVLEECYGISLRKLAVYAENCMDEDARFYPVETDGSGRRRGPRDDRENAQGSLFHAHESGRADHRSPPRIRYGRPPGFDTHRLPKGHRRFGRGRGQTQPLRLYHCRPCRASYVHCGGTGSARRAQTRLFA